MITTTSKKSKKSLPPIVFILIGSFFIGTYSLSMSWQKSSTLERNQSVQAQMSSGERILIEAETTPEKELGVGAYANGDYKQAVLNFQTSLNYLANDPESLIYLNNAKAGHMPSRTIAVSIPISSNLNIAQEILRGVAQEQQATNQNGGMKGLMLKVKIVDDRNDPDLAKNIASELVNDDQVLAVVGHNASDASVAAAPIYQQGRLVMMSPTSMASGLSGIGNYIFRTVPDTRSMAVPLTQYILKSARKSRIAVCFDSLSKDNLNFKDEFIASFTAQGGKFINSGCDFVSPQFDPAASANQAIRQGADSVLLAPHVDRLDRAIDLAHEVKGRLAVFGSPTLYTSKVLQSGAQDVNGLVLSVPWHPSISRGNPKLDSAHDLWKGEINWRTASAIDATHAIIAGLRTSNNREMLQQTLHNPEFSTQGLMGAIRFLPTGDRQLKPVLIRVQPDPKSNTGYSFVALQ